jgi:hypothetical protein
VHNSAPVAITIQDLHGMRIGAQRKCAPTRSVSNSRRDRQRQEAGTPREASQAQRRLVAGITETSRGAIADWPASPIRRVFLPSQAVVLRTWSGSSRGRKYSQSRPKATIHTPQAGVFGVSIDVERSDESTGRFRFFLPSLIGSSAATQNRDFGG